MPSYQQILTRLIDYIPLHPEHCQIISIDGLIVAGLIFANGVWKFPIEKWYEEDRLPALSTAALSLGERIAHEIHDELYTSSLIHNEKGIIYQLVLDDELVIYIVWSNGLTIPKLYQKWDELQNFFVRLKQALKESE